MKVLCSDLVSACASRWFFRAAFAPHYTFRPIAQDPTTRALHVGRRVRPYRAPQCTSSSCCVRLPALFLTELPLGVSMLRGELPRFLFSVHPCNATYQMPSWCFRGASPSSCGRCICVTIAMEKRVHKVFLEIRRTSFHVNFFACQELVQSILLARNKLSTLFILIV